MLILLLAIKDCVFVSHAVCCVSYDVSLWSGAVSYLMKSFGSQQAWHWISALIMWIHLLSYQSYNSQPYMYVSRTCIKCVRYANKDSSCCETKWTETLLNPQPFSTGISLGPCFNIKTILPGKLTPQDKTKWSHDSFYLIMAIPILARFQIYIEMTLRQSDSQAGQSRPTAMPCIIQPAGLFTQPMWKTFSFLKNKA